MDNENKILEMLGILVTEVKQTNTRLDSLETEVKQIMTKLDSVEIDLILLKAKAKENLESLTTLVHTTTIKNNREELYLDIIKLKSELKILGDKLSTIAILTYQNSADIEKLKKAQ